MYDLLNGLRVVEAASFIAAPSCALHLLQMGAEVIRIDQAGGGPDYNRWPLAPGGGRSLYWEGLNKGKKSVALDLARPEGRELATAIITAPGDEGGLFVTNYPVGGFLSWSTTTAKLRLAQAAMGQPGTKIGELCTELGVSWQTLYRHVTPQGELRPDGLSLLARRKAPQRIPATQERN